VLYECLAGTPPFHRPSEVAVLNAHLHAPPPKLTRAAPEVPPGLEHVIAKALSKSPLDRYASCGEFLSAARAAASERRVHRLRLAVSVSLLVLAALIGAVAALAVRAVDFGGKSDSAPPPPPPSRQLPQKSLSQLLLKSDDGGTLNDVAYTLLVAHQYERALPFAQKAVEKVEPGTLTEGYANFNLGYTLFRLGRCAEAVPRMQKAVGLEPVPQRPYIRLRIKQAKRCARREASSPRRSR
jgi:serine/threonine protein kinase